MESTGPGDALLERLFERPDSLIAHLSSDFTYVRVNRAFAAAGSRDPSFFVGRSHFDLFPDPETEATFRSVVETGRAHRATEEQLPFPGGDGDRGRFWDWSLETVEAPDEGAPGLFLTLRDTSERRRAKEALRDSEETREEMLSDHRRVEHDRTRLAAVIDQADEGTLGRQLRQAQKMEALGTLAGGIAHDLNNILMPIIMNAEMLEEDLEPGSHLHHFAGKVLTSAHRGRDLVRRILDFSREKDEERRRFDIATPVREALDLVRPTIPTTVEIRQSIASDVGQVEGDPSQIQEVIINLCTNAAQAIGQEAGSIEVSLGNAFLDEKRARRYSDLEAGPYVKLSVSDTGCGMDEKQIDRIFEPFFTTKKPSEGTGMGLAMVHGTVRRHRGGIDVRSAPGEGATFEVLLPRVEEKGAEKKDPAPLPRGLGERLFLVDDEQDIVETTRDVLERLGYEVSIATNAHAAIESFRREGGSIDLAILDFSLPEMTGLELARQLKDIRPDMPIILATGFSGAVDRSRLRAAGVGDLVDKPLTSGEIGAVIRRALKRKKSNEQG
jgi:signal transduction histidine kinase/ActR/RegA family two-component response regulator